MVRALIEKGADINKATDDGATPLFMAAGMGNEAAVRALIELGSDVNKATEDGASVTPLFIAAHQDHAAIAQILRDSGAV